jgi:hypothetical protein
VHDSVEVPDPSRLVWVREHVRPVAGDTVSARSIVRVRSPSDVTAIEDSPDVPALVVTDVVEGEIVKSKTLTLNVTS